MRLFLALLGLLMGLSAFASPKIINLTLNNSVSFNQPFRGDYTSKKALEVMDKHSKLPYGQPIYLILDTPGGSVTDGNQFIDLLKALGRPIHTITIFAASMGYQTVQNLGTRYILPSGILMSHRGSLGGLSGQIPGEINTRLNFYMSMMKDLDVRAAKRVGLTFEQYSQLIWNELWVAGNDAVKGNHADEVILAKCDKSLIGSYEETVNTFFGPVLVEYSKCPLVTAPISVKFSRTVDLKTRTDFVTNMFNNRRKVVTEL